MSTKVDAPVEDEDVNQLNVLAQTINIQRAHMVSVTARIFVGHDDLSVE
jgi:hypothetical protein